MTASLMDHLQEQGYMPQDDPRNDGEWYDLVISGTGTVRACIYPNDAYRADVHYFNRYMSGEWSASFTPGAPDAVIIAALQAAEWQLADKRGGPVTPAQAGRAS